MITTYQSSPEQLLRPPHNEAVDFNESERLYYDTATWLAEVLPGQMRTQFEYTYKNGELYGEDGGALKPIFETAIRDAEQLARRNPGLGFEKRRRQIEMDEYRAMLNMSSNTMVVVSDFPPELRNATKDIGGYNVDRQQTMLRVISRTPDGRLIMRSQSLDRSDRASLEAIYGYFGMTPQPGELLGQRINIDLPEHEQEFLMDWLVGVYDRSMTAEHGGQWYAGRTPAEIQNTYDFVMAQSDLLQAYTEQIKLRGPDNSLRYGLAAAMTKRFKLRRRSGRNGEITVNTANMAQVLDEIGRAGNEARLLGTDFSGCGFTSAADQDQSSESQMSALGFGNKSNEDQYGSLTFLCPKGHRNTRPRGKLIPNCRRCGISVRC